MCQRAKDLSIWQAMSQPRREEGGKGYRRLTLTGDERDELADALLHALLGLLCNLCVLREGIFHDAGDWGKVAYVSIVDVPSGAVVPVLVGGGSAARFRGFW